MLDGKPRRVEFGELENGITQRVNFPEEQKKANQGALNFGILCLVIGVAALVFSLMTGIKFR